MTMGVADNLLLSVARAWDTAGDSDGKKKSVIVAAMNTAMWRHAVTRKQIAVLEGEWGVNGISNGWIEVLRPREKVLARGDNGDGAMMKWMKIVGMAEDRLQLEPFKDQGKRE